MNIEKVRRVAVVLSSTPVVQSTRKKKKCEKKISIFFFRVQHHVNKKNCFLVFFHVNAEAKSESMGAVFLRWPFPLLIILVRKCNLKLGVLKRLSWPLFCS